MKTMDLVLQDGWLLFHHGGGGGGGGSGPDCGLPGAGRLSVSVPGELWNVMELHEDVFKDSPTLLLIWCVTGHGGLTTKEIHRVLHRRGLLQQEPASHPAAAQASP